MSEPTSSQNVSVQERLKLASQLEARMQQKQPSSAASRNSRIVLCKHLSDVLMEDPKLAMRKDCSGRLWRGCFYPSIVELRGRISKEKSRMGKTRGGNKQLSTNIADSEKALQVFLDEAVLLYKFLVVKYEEMLSTLMSQSQSQGSSSSNSGKNLGIVPNLYRLLIHLGDLHRYSSSYSEAEACYMKASKLAPGRGNPYNQLAVIAQHPATEQPHPRTCVALFWYTRSLLATYEPFDTSKANLKRLFESNREWLKDNINNDSQIGSIASRRFLARFVDLHSLFFVKDFGQLSIAITAASHLFTNFQNLLAENRLSENLIHQMVAIHAFSAQYQNKKQKKIETHSFAMACALRLGSCVASHILNQAESPLSKRDSRMIAPLLLLCEWLLTTQPDYFHFGEDIADDLHAFCESSSLVFWESLVPLANVLVKVNTSPVKPVPLKEHESMKGFQPFAKFIGNLPKTSFFHADTDTPTTTDINFRGFLSPQDGLFALNPEPTSEDDADRFRIHRFLHFVSATMEHTEKSGLEGAVFLYLDKDTNEFSFQDPNKKKVEPDVEDVQEDYTDPATLADDACTGSEISAAMAGKSEASTPYKNLYHEITNNQQNEENYTMGRNVNVPMEEDDEYDSIVYSGAAAGESVIPLLIPNAPAISASKLKDKQKNENMEEIFTKVKEEEPSPMKSGLTLFQTGPATGGSSSLLKPFDLTKSITNISNSFNPIPSNSSSQAENTKVEKNSHLTSLLGNTNKASPSIMNVRDFTSDLPMKMSQSKTLPSPPPQALLPTPPQALLPKHLAMQAQQQPPKQKPGLLQQHDLRPPPGFSAVTVPVAPNKNNKADMVLENRDKANLSPKDDLPYFHKDNQAGQMSFSGGIFGMGHIIETSSRDVSTLGTIQDNRFGESAILPPPPPGFSVSNTDIWEGQNNHSELVRNISGVQMKAKDNMPFVPEFPNRFSGGQINPENNSSELVRNISGVQMKAKNDRPFVPEFPNRFSGGQINPENNRPFTSEFHNRLPSVAGVKNDQLFNSGDDRPVVSSNPFATHLTPLYGFAENRNNGNISNPVQGQLDLNCMDSTPASKVNNDNGDFLMGLGGYAIQESPKEFDFSLDRNNDNILNMSSLFQHSDANSLNHANVSASQEQGFELGSLPAWNMSKKNSTPNSRILTRNPFLT